MPYFGRYTCMGCGTPADTTDAGQRLCPDCYAAMLEGIAHALDKAYDPAVWHDPQECYAILAGLYPEWEIRFQPCDKGRGPGKSDYVPMRCVGGAWREVR